jgi:hypothetical protein
MGLSIYPRAELIVSCDNRYSSDLGQHARRGEKLPKSARGGQGSDDEGRVYWPLSAPLNLNTIFVMCCACTHAVMMYLLACMEQCRTALNAIEHESFNDIKRECCLRLWL